LLDHPLGVFGQLASVPLPDVVVGQVLADVFGGWKNLIAWQIVPVFCNETISAVEMRLAHSGSRGITPEIISITINPHVSDDFRKIGTRPCITGLDSIRVPDRNFAAIELHPICPVITLVSALADYCVFLLAHLILLFLLC